jgi:hypothetical protein
MEAASSKRDLGEEMNLKPKSRLGVLLCILFALIFIGLAVVILFPAIG